jgi:hypothetical protein
MAVSRARHVLIYFWGNVFVGGRERGPTNFSPKQRKESEGLGRLISIFGSKLMSSINQLNTRPPKNMDCFSEESAILSQPNFNPKTRMV